MFSSQVSVLLGLGFLEHCEFLKGSIAYYPLHQSIGHGCLDYLLNSSLGKLPFQ